MVSRLLFGARVFVMCILRLHAAPLICSRSPWRCLQVDVPPMDLLDPSLRIPDRPRVARTLRRHACSALENAFPVCDRSPVDSHGSRLDGFMFLHPADDLCGLMHMCIVAATQALRRTLPIHAGAARYFLGVLKQFGQECEFQVGTRFVKHDSLHQHKHACSARSRLPDIPPVHVSLQLLRGSCRGALSPQHTGRSAGLPSRHFYLPEALEMPKGAVSSIIVFYVECHRH